MLLLAAIVEMRSASSRSRPPAATVRFRPRPGRRAVPGFVHARRPSKRGRTGVNHHRVSGARIRECEAGRGECGACGDCGAHRSPAPPCRGLARIGRRRDRQGIGVMEENRRRSSVQRRRRCSKIAKVAPSRAMTSSKVTCNLRTPRRNIPNFRNDRDFPEKTDNPRVQPAIVKAARSSAASAKLPRERTSACPFIVSFHRSRRRRVRVNSQRSQPHASDRNAAESITRMIQRSG